MLENITLYISVPLQEGAIIRDSLVDTEPNNEWNTTATLGNGKN